MNSPCRFCDKRHLKCHSDCKLYDDYKKENEKKKQYLQKDADIYDYICQQRRKRTKKGINGYDL